jgi:hypothetical protein
MPKQGSVGFVVQQLVHSCQAIRQEIEDKQALARNCRDSGERAKILHDADLLEIALDALLKYVETQMQDHEAVNDAWALRTLKNEPEVRELKRCATKVIGRKRVRPSSVPATKAS